MPTADNPFHMATPAHQTAWISHLRIAHCLALRTGRETAEADLPEIHEQLHQRPLNGTIHHIHTPRTPAADGGDEDHGFW